MTKRFLSSLFFSLLLLILSITNYVRAEDGKLLSLICIIIFFVFLIATIFLYVKNKKKKLS